MSKKRACKESAARRARESERAGRQRTDRQQQQLTLMDAPVVVDKNL